ncbi:MULTISPECIES: mannose-1-phosphate guanylyltransferase/mannose-6-phosphate isomerase [unclassified Azospirillum]|uniref:mannose-1-phosphate guanylyltransferase/mannose-6-phosphate isomerase n=1 Tax=unclassified Azospirillum TaxID=2630922 RepID=UPI000B6FC0A8|nr:MULTISPECIES: mannose-1-phosphate guanylyltransferase/mannose-6-phosphate isomerase [unclassified Azospirillum]SNS68642.1 mannose-1-phosphate guanylyltransferase (GDP) /mannose-6-phosphate isomerase, type 2 [Azospirillum sp. RU38E]SNS86806.1 mannose-1-phosphate guanylyltransferase (GDP) /mannose-6-phosphate isomerase, type 2 [Azospirillum sp. RU37A]
MVEGWGARLVPVILSGGSGTRLWPLSRENYPKQFLRLMSDRSLLQETVVRCQEAGFAAPMLVASEGHRFVVAEQLLEQGVEPQALLLEPVARNTGPAICAAALLLAETDPDRLMLVLPADHVITDGDAWAEAVRAAAPAAAAGLLMTFGIRPERAETGFGWIAEGQPLDDLPGAFHIAEFVEKPERAVAEAMLAGGRHVWNSGMFLFKPSQLVAEMERFEPDLVAHVRAAVAGRRKDTDFVRLAAEPFGAARSISIDDAVFARTKLAGVMPCSIGWNDIGSWAALHDIVERDEHGNVALGDAVIERSEGCYVRTDGVLTAVLGARDLVVVATSDAILVADKAEVQNVKTIVQRLKKAGRSEAESRPRQYRPWGYFQPLQSGHRFQVKRLMVKPGEKLSLQRHFHRSEHWIVVNGTALVTRDGEQFMVRENESVYLPIGSVHRLENPGCIPLNLIEVAAGSYLGEDDIVRLEDDYGRE